MEQNCFILATAVGFSVSRVKDPYYLGRFKQRAVQKGSPSANLNSRRNDDTPCLHPIFAVPAFL